MGSMMKNIAVLGSTGSIGTQTLEVVRENGDIRVTGLAAGRNIGLLEKQIREFVPSLAVVWDEEKAKELAVRVADLPVRILAGMEGLLELAAMPEAELLVTAVVGMIGIRPTIAAIEAGKDIALANKETLVTAGHLIMPLARKRGVRILPVDSGHSAIFQCLNGEDKRAVHKILLTASGGPFFGMKSEELRKVTKTEALRHPNWSMGPKITIDCATLMNKGLEVIEAMRLYDLPLEQVDVVVHRQSVIHSMVELRDGAVMAQMGAPDMRLPIQLALTYPERVNCPAPALDLLACGPLTFDRADEKAFPCLALAKRAARRGGSACAILNGANEAAVALFLEDRIGFYGIAEAVESALEEVPVRDAPDLDALLEADRAAREQVYANL